MESQYYTRTFHRFFYYPEYADLVRRNAEIVLGEMQHLGGSNKYLRRYRRTKRVKRARRNKNKTKKSRKIENKK